MKTRLAVLALALLASTAFASGDLKALFTQPDKALVAKVGVLKHSETGGASMVPISTSFASGDQVRLEFESNRQVTGIIYSKAPNSDEVTRVYPPEGDGMTIAANTPTIFPPAGWLRFEGVAGTETLIIHLTEPGRASEEAPAAAEPEYAVATNETTAVEMKTRKNKTTSVIQIALKAIVWDPPAETVRYVSAAADDGGQLAMQIALEHQ